MIYQVASCVIAAFAFGYWKMPTDFWLGWTWFFYGIANIGFAMKALGH
jgi:hypothetical protein